MHYFIELGNIYLGRGSREQALEAFTSARDHAITGTVFRRDLENQVRLLSSSAPPLTNSSSPGPRPRIGPAVREFKDSPQF